MKISRGSLFVVIIATIALVGCVAAGARENNFKTQQVFVQSNADQVEFSNGFVFCSISISKQETVTIELRGDTSGSGKYGRNVFAGKGISLEVVTAGKYFLGKTSSPSSSPSIRIDQNSTDLVAVTVLNVGNQIVSEDWKFILAKGDRFVDFKTEGKITGEGKDVTISTIHHDFCMVPTSIYALFDRGIVQMKDAKNSNVSMYPSLDNLSRLYALGGNGGDLDTRGDVSLSIHRNNPQITLSDDGKNFSPFSSPFSSSSSSIVTLLSNAKASPCSTGFRETLFGQASKMIHFDSWGNDPAEYMQPFTIGDILPQGNNNNNNQFLSWSSSAQLYPGNIDAPVIFLADIAPNEMSLADQHAFLIGTWASIVGNVNSHDNEIENGHRVAQIATTIHRPDVGYLVDGKITSNYFDPDNFIGTSALLYSGDPYLQDQVRQVVERSGEFLNEQGQIPHHFVGVDPVFQALSGETQTGPNIFWTLSCLNYAKTSGNIAWLKGYMPILRNASRFLFDLFDEEYGLVSAPGSLMIDVFIRNNLTSDSNAMLVGFFRELADAEQVVGNVTGAATLRQLSDKIVAGMNKYLWATDEEGNDHYITDLNPKDGSRRDFIDYDSNLIAAAHNIPDPARLSKLLARVDRGRCTHGRATFVSEVYYGSSDTTHGNTGDSWCSMGRIGWFDALARKNGGDLTTFDEVILNPLRDDLLEWTWLHERYGCDGKPQTNRTAMYFEYPAVVTMMIRQIRYGIQMNLHSLDISPFGPTQFVYHFGNVFVDYSPSAVQYSVPRSEGELEVTIASLLPNTTFVVSASGECTTKTLMMSPSEIESDGNGTVRFVAPAGEKCLISVKKKDV